MVSLNAKKYNYEGLNVNMFFFVKKAPVLEALTSKNTNQLESKINTY